MSPSILARPSLLVEVEVGFVVTVVGAVVTVVGVVVGAAFLGWALVVSVSRSELVVRRDGVVVAVTPSDLLPFPPLSPLRPAAPLDDGGSTAM